MKLVKILLFLIVGLSILFFVIHQKVSLVPTKKNIPFIEKYPTKNNINDRELIPPVSAINELDFINEISDAPVASVSDWSFFGPKNAGGRVRDIAVDLDNSNILLCGGVSGGIFRSTNAGESWERVSSTEYIRLSSMAQDPRPSHRNKWYATTGELPTYNIFPILGHGIYKSEDNGITWNRLSSSFSDDPEPNLSHPFDITQRVVVHPETGDVYVAALNGIYRSQNEGTSFEKVLGNDNVQISAKNDERTRGHSEIHIAADKKIYATVNIYPNPNIENGGFYISTSGNANDWESITPEFVHDSIFRVVIASSPTPPNNVYFLSAFYNADFSLYSVLNRDTYLYRYSPATSSWNDLSNNLPASREHRAPYTQGGYNMDIAVHPNNPNIIVMGLIGIFWSTNGFTDASNTYERRVNDIIHADIHSFAFDPNNSNIMYIASDGGINKTTQSLMAFQNLDVDILNKYFTLNNTGLSVAQCYDISIASNAVYAGTQDQSAWLGSNERNDWLSYPGGDVTKTASSKDGKYLIYSTSAGTNELLVNIDTSFLTKNDNESITLDDHEIERLINTDIYLSSYVFDPTQMYRFIGVSSAFDPRGLRLYVIDRIDKFAENPTDNLPRFLPVSDTSMTLNLIKISSYPNHIIYGATYGSQVSVFREEEFPGVIPTLVRLDNVFSPTPTVTRLSKEGFPESRISSIAINSYHASHVLISFDRYDTESKILFSDDGGDSWQNITGNLMPENSSSTGPSILSAGIMGNDSIFFVGTSSGLFSTSLLNNEQTIWQRVNPNVLKNHIVRDIEIDQNDRITVGTYGGGVYQAEYDMEANLEVGFRQPIQNVKMSSSSTKIINLENFIFGNNPRVEVSSTNPELVSASIIQNNSVRLTSQEREGNSIITITLHGNTIGSTESFVVQVLDDTQPAQIDIDFRINTIDPTENIVSGIFEITNTGNEHITIKNFSSNLYLPSVTTPISLPSGDTREFIGYSYQNLPLFLTERIARLVLEINKSPHIVFFNKSVNFTPINTHTHKIPVVNIYPNPTQNFINIESDTFIKAVLYNLSGKYLIKSSHKQMNVSSLNTGIYLLKIYTHNGISHTKVIKQ